MPPTTRRLLAAVARRRPVVVLAGRARAEVLARLRGVPLRHVIGSHGAEWASDRPSAAARARLGRWARALEARLGRDAGIMIEDKGFSIAAHYRGAPSPHRARRRIVEVAAEVAREADIVPGKMVLNVALPGHDKAAALARLHRRYPRRPLVFVGDDENDERGFAARVPNVVSVRVGRHPGSSADFFLSRQEQVADLLRAFLEVRA
jgi:trehalose 6-phosphate phosphatase